MKRIADKKVKIIIKTVVCIFAVLICIYAVHTVISMVFAYHHNVGRSAGIEGLFGVNMWAFIETSEILTEAYEQEKAKNPALSMVTLDSSSLYNLDGKWKVYCVAEGEGDSFLRYEIEVTAPLKLQEACYNIAQSINREYHGEGGLNVRVTQDQVSFVSPLRYAIVRVRGLESPKGISDSSPIIYTQWLTFGWYVIYY